MAKKQKGNIPVRPAASAPAPQSSTLARIFATQQVAATVIGDPPVLWEEAEVKALCEVIPADQRARFDAVIDRQLCELGKAMHKAHKAGLDAQAEAASKLDQLNERERAFTSTKLSQESEWEEKKAALATRSLEVEQDAAALKSREAALDQRERELAALKLTLDEQEDGLKQGLVRQETAMLRSVGEQLAALRAERDMLALAIEADRKKLMTDARAKAQEVLTAALDRKAHWERLIAEVTAREVDLERDKATLTEGEMRFRARRQSLSDEIQTRVDEAVAAQQAELDAIKGQLEEAHQQVDVSETALHKLQDALRKSGGDPARLVEEVRSLKHQLEQRREEVAQLRASLESGDPAALKRRVDDLQEQLAQKQSALAALEADKHRWELSVVERQGWERTRLVMESSRRLLNEQVEQLQSQVNDLTNQQRAASMFPELDRMDRDFTMPANTEPIQDLKKFTVDLRLAMSHAGEQGPLTFRETDLQLFVGGLAMSQLHILQGISGTGKTSMATAFAKAIGAQLTVIAVQAGWRERADLLGYFNAFDRKFYELKTLQAIYQAQTPRDEDRLHVVLLDEMNLSRPEQYFADFLSALEGEGSVRNLRLVDNRIENAPKCLIDGRDLALPRNVWFIGTANQDETTNAFADKTYDRSFVMEVHRPGIEAVDLKRPGKPSTLSFRSLVAAFDGAEKEAQERSRRQIAKLTESRLSKTLESEFSTGWGSRLERQWRRFVPVVVAAGGEEGMAVDHLLHSRVIRDGKVTGRHDIAPSQLEVVGDDLKKLWADLGLPGEPRNCLSALERDKRRLERGG